MRSMVDARSGPHSGEAVDALGHDVGERCDVALHRRALLPGLVDHLDKSAKADGDEEGDDQRGHGPAQCRLSGKQPVVGRFRDQIAPIP